MIEAWRRKVPGGLPRRPWAPPLPQTSSATVAPGRGAPPVSRRPCIQGTALTTRARARGRSYPSIDCRRPQSISGTRNQRRGFRFPAPPRVMPLMHCCCYSSVGMLSGCGRKARNLVVDAARHASSSTAAVAAAAVRITDIEDCLHGGRKYRMSRVFTYFV